MLCVVGIRGRSRFCLVQSNGGTIGQRNPFLRRMCYKTRRTVDFLRQVAFPNYGLRQGLHVPDASCRGYGPVTEIHAIVRHLTSAGASAPSVLATLVTVQGSSYRRPGARLLILGDGIRMGSVSGGCLEEDILERAQKVAETGLPSSLSTIRPPKMTWSGASGWVATASFRCSSSDSPSGRRGPIR